RLYLALAGQWSRTLGIPENPATLADFVAARLATDNRTKQELLETLSVARRLQREEEILGQEIRALAARLRAAQRQRYSGLGALN
ncbi:MAG: LON peptidase substrate-binding domain-containing protein, partial [Dehalococcoidia bacterium]